jgi:tripeptidyl-peptidase-1
VAALAHNYYIEINGDVGAISGTSAATPVVAGMIGLLNSYRASKQLPNVGFANPLLYKIAAETKGAFNDITAGNNRCSEGGCWCHTGFAAAPGW